MRQHSLFSEAQTSQRKEAIELPDGEITLYHNWLQPEEATDFFSQLYATLQWEQSIIRIYGKDHPIPRLNAWYGDSGQRYTYSGTTFEPLPWTEALATLKERITQTSGYLFNSVLANLYRDGKDSVSWHADDEPELGKNPVIASISLGAERRFVLKHRRKRDLSSISIPLATGSLLLMASNTQHNWIHQVPKTAKIIGPRINLTYRLIKPSD